MRTGVVLAFDVAGLARLARRADCLLEFVPQVGDFVTWGRRRSTYIRYRLARSKRVRREA